MLRFVECIHRKQKERFVESVHWTQMVRLVNKYRKLHGSRSINEKSHACLAKCLFLPSATSLNLSNFAVLNIYGENFLLGCFNIQRVPTKTSFCKL